MKRGFFMGCYNYRRNINGGNTNKIPYGDGSILKSYV